MLLAGKTNWAYGMRKHATIGITWFYWSVHAIWRLDVGKVPDFTKKRVQSVYLLSSRRVSPLKHLDRGEEELRPPIYGHSLLLQC